MEDGGILVTSNYVLDETLTLIRMRLGMPATRRWWDLVSESPRCKIEWVTPHQASRAIQWFFKWRDQSFSFTDCTSFVMMRDRGLTEVLTADRHFNIAGFKMLPSAE
jgi:predicted nucleic acid-binding protein